jgi:serine/threonine protein kinase
LTLILGMMLLDLIEGQELKDILHCRRRLPEEEASCLLLQAMRAVAYMHAQRVVHRDISPRNLLVTNAACLYIIDFGLAVDLEGDLSDVSAGAGTMGYQVSFRSLLLLY